MLADPVKRADQRRVFCGYLHLADRGRERITPGEGVGIAQGGLPVGKAIEEVEVGRLSADIIDCISSKRR